MGGGEDTGHMGLNRGIGGQSCMGRLLGLGWDFGTQVLKDQCIEHELAISVRTLVVLGVTKWYLVSPWFMDCVKVK